MSRTLHVRNNAARSDSGAQLVEFAFAVPILLLLVVGIWDFGSSLLLKQKMTNAAREGARIMVSTPMIGMTGASCTGSAAPCSVQAAATSVQQYLNNAGLDGSWISPASPSSSSACKWSYTTKTNANYELDIAANATITVNPSAATPTTILATQVTLTWPLVWALRSLLPKGIFPTKMSTTFTMANIGGGC